MSAFLQHIIARHTSPVQPVQPRLYNRFEPVVAEEPLTGELKETDTRTDTVAAPQAEMVSQPVSTPTTSTIAAPENIAERSFLNETKQAGYFEQAPGDMIDQTTFNPASPLPETQDGKIEGAHTVQPNLFITEPAITKNIDQGSFRMEEPEILHKPGQSLLNAAPLPVSLNVASENMGKPGAVNMQGHSVIKVTIGRVDVRANAAAQPTKSRSAAQEYIKMSLEDYFNRKAAPHK